MIKIDYGEDVAPYLAVVTVGNHKAMVDRYGAITFSYPSGTRSAADARNLGIALTVASRTAKRLAADGRVRDLMADLRMDRQNRQDKKAVIDAAIRDALRSTQESDIDR